MTHLRPNCPFPSNVQAFTSQRMAGNLGLHVGDVQEHVIANRNKLPCPSTPLWLEQTHSNVCLIAEKDKLPLADALITREKNTVLAIMTADCLPILLCNKEGSEIAAIHAGWRGLHSGIIENTLAKLESESKDMTAWCGPAICQNCYEIGEEVYTSFLERYPFAEPFFKSRGQKWLFNLPGLAEEILYQSSISAVYQSQICTFEDTKTYFSYRKEQETGRMGTFIWFT